VQQPAKGRLTAQLPRVGRLGYPRAPPGAPARQFPGPSCLLILRGDGWRVPEWSWRAGRDFRYRPTLHRPHPQNTSSSQASSSLETSLVSSRLCYCTVLFIMSRPGKDAFHACLPGYPPAGACKAMYPLAGLDSCQPPSYLPPPCSLPTFHRHISFFLIIPSSSTLACRPSSLHSLLPTPACLRFTR
jgi:hypothetical protein